MLSNVKLYLKGVPVCPPPVKRQPFRACSLSKLGRYKFLYFLLAIAAMFVVDTTGPPELLLFALLWLPVLLAASMLPARQVAFLGVVAFGLTIVTWSAHPHGLNSTHLIIEIIVSPMISLFAVLMAANREKSMRLLATEQKYKLLAENGSDVVFSVSNIGIIEWVSESVSTLLGFQPSQCIGQLSVDFAAPEDRPAVRSCIARAHQGETTRFEVRVSTSSGDLHWVEVTIRPIFDANGIYQGHVGSLRDIQLELEVRQLAENKKAMLQATLDSLLDPHVLLTAVRDQDGNIIDFIYAEANQAACSYNKIERDQLIGARLLEILPGQAGSGMLEMYSKAIESGQPLALDDFAYFHENYNEERYFDVRAVRVGDSLSYTWRDVTDRHNAAKKLVASELNFRLLAENSSSVVIRTGDDYRVTWVSPSLLNTLGWEPQEWIGRQWAEFIHPEEVTAFANAKQKLTSGRSAGVDRIRILAKSGEFNWIDIISSPFRHADGKLEGLVASFHTVDEQVASQQELDQRARTDQLTGLLNRKEVLDRFDLINNHGSRTGKEAAVLFCDLDRFKNINDTYGHLIGDQVLCTIADRIKSCLRENDLIARFGGDEFLVMLVGVQDLENASLIAEKLRLACLEPMQSTAGEIYASLSIGVTLARKGESSDAMISRADRAMYLAKKQGRDQVIPIPVTG